MSKFKNGDKVKVKVGKSSSSKELDGRIGIVINAENNRECCNLDIEDDKTGVWYDELELVFPKREFKIGDRVRVVSYWGCIGNSEIDGNEGIFKGMTKKKGYEGEYTVDVGGFLNEIIAHKIELIEPVEVEKYQEEYKAEYKDEVKHMVFEVGDKVKMLNLPSGCIGTFPEDMIGKVVTIDSVVGRVFTINKNKWSCNVCAKDMELISKNNEVKSMDGETLTSEIDLKDMKGANREEAKKQCVEERKNAEIEEAKRQYNRAVDERDRLDRNIKQYQELKDKQQEILDKFKSAK